MLYKCYINIMTYKCQRCGYNSEYKIAVINHLKRKQKCPPLNSNKDTIELLQSLEPNIIKKYNCSNCGKYFSHMASLYRHNKTCKPLLKLNDSVYTKIDHLLKEIEKLKKQNTGTTINKNTNFNNTINNNININAYGSHTPKLSYNELEKVLKIGARNAITRLIEKNHFNKEKPENMNFYISNYKDNIGRVYDGETWIMKDGDELVNEIYDLYQSLVDNLIDEITYYSEDETEQQNFKAKLLEKINDTIDTWCKRTNNNKFIDGLKEDLKKHFYSKKAVVKKVHNIKGS